MKAKLITYELSNLDQYHKVLVNRELFGYLDNSNKGRYQYRRKGILSNISYFKLVNGALIIKDNDKDKVTSILKKYKINYNILSIIPKKQMLN